MSMKDDDRSLREALAAALDGVGQDVAEPIAALQRRSRIQRRLIMMVSALAGITAVTLAIVVALLIGVSNTSHQIEQIQQRTSDKVLCPLYGAFLAAKDNPVPDNIKNDPAQLEERAQAFKVIEMGAAELGCLTRDQRG